MIVYVFGIGAALLIPLAAVLLALDIAGWSRRKPSGFPVDLKKKGG